MWKWAAHKRPAAGPEALAASGPGAATAPVARCAKCIELPAKIDRLLADHRARVHEHIQHAQALSEKEILAIGENVQNIVDHTRQYIDVSKHTTEENFSAQTRSLNDYLEYARGSSDAQHHAVIQALALSDDIAHAGAAVDRLASQARLLALNAKIEAARLGGAGSAFGVITEQMNHLSLEIAKTNRLIADATQAIRECLPVIAEQNTAQIRRLETFTATMRQLKADIENSLSSANTAGDTHINMILTLAYAALSHLQFQDPMIQGVQKIDFLARDLHDEVNATLDIPAPQNTPSPYIETLGSKMDEETQGDAGVHAGVHAGEVILFSP